MHRSALPPLPRTLPSLSTPRLLLRAFDAGDSAELFAIYGDSEVMRFVGEPPFPSLATVAQMLASDSGRLIGTCGLHSFASETGLRQAEVGCMLARSHWGEGWMAEALTALIAYARQLGIATLVADIEPDNLPSQRLFRRLGFVWQQATCYRLSLEKITPDRG
ncbi:GNAT family N-acetyltransferase [Aeromonas hydrophila]|uniref:GNAT family N-acetyltransferase n=1 Tax=Aeromonas hydrophila TaxID=644 RepID=UPI00214D3112|nr:GNAT family N-acetyltransferase [Aeromonas hydrophila]MCR3903995.1 GNAT family N-acetyltransferase [Aeromonas hydrophila]